MSEYIENDGIGPHSEAMLEEIVFSNEYSINFVELSAMSVSKAKHWSFKRVGKYGEIVKYKLKQ